MKVRTDFVSNSSSSSFVLVGKIFEAEDIVKQFAKKNKLPADIQTDYDNGDINADDVLYELEDRFDGLEMQSTYDDGGDTTKVCLGLSPDNMKDTETLGKFKEKIVKQLNDIGLKAKKSEVDFVTGGSDASGMSFFGSCG